MAIIFFFYGLAFIVMGAVIFLMLKRNDFLDLSDDLWLLGLFGLLHGLNEWVDMFILIGQPFNIEILKNVGTLLLPISYVFLVLFSGRVLSGRNSNLKWLRSLWIICLLIWLVIYIFKRNFLISGIAARYFICVPGTLLTAFSLYICLKGAEKKYVPRIIKVSVYIAAVAIILYGILSGLVVPKTEFLLANIINYTNFIAIFKLPPQFFRMICAIVMAVSFFFLTGLFYQEGGQARLRGGIRRKVILYGSMSAFLVMVIGFTLVGSIRERFFLHAATLTLFLISLIIFSGVVLGNLISRPIAKLKEASGRIANGELDYPVEIKTGDELEDLASSFRAMSASIKERDALLASQKAYLEGIITSMADSLIVVNPDATIKSVNKSALNLLGYEERELIGQPVKKIFLQEKGDEDISRYFQKIISESITYNTGLTFLTKEGDKIPINFTGTVMREIRCPHYDKPKDDCPEFKKKGSHCEKIVGIVGIARDMRHVMAIINDLEKKTRDLEKHSKNLRYMQKAMLEVMDDLKSANEELKKALSVKTEFTKMVSHELRTPLAAIKEGVSLVLDKIVGDINEEQARYLNIVENNVDRLVRLITAILDFQKLESGKIEFRIEDNDINEIIRQIYNTMMPLCEKKGLTLGLQLCDNLPQVKLDRDKITQVLTNLVNNAHKFTERGSISISTARGDGFIQVMVKDTGIGIKEENMQKLFREFTQIERKTGGTGLGLSICKRIIDAHNGKIWAESEFGSGTCFYFNLPIR